MKLITFLAMLFAMVSTSPVYAEQVAGTSVSIEPPPGFVAADRFSGFFDRERGASIMVSDIPGEFEQTGAAFRDKAQLLARGMTLLSHADTTVDTRRALLVEAEQSAQGQRFKKWLVLVEREKGVSLLVATLPEGAIDALEAPLKSALLSARFGAPSDPYAALGFAITPVAPFEYAHALGQTLILTPEGLFPLKDPQMPSLVVGLSASQDAAIADRKAFAERRILQVADIKDTRLERSKPIRVGGLEGYASLATGKHAPGNDARTLYQVMLFDQDGYALILGSMPTKSRSTHLPIFERMAKTFLLKRK